MSVAGSAVYLQTKKLIALENVKWLLVAELYLYLSQTT